MKTQCEKCAAALKARDAAYVCGYECTFCAECAELMKFVCPNCSGRLALRPASPRRPP